MTGSLSERGEVHIPGAYAIRKGASPRGGARWFVHSPDGTALYVNLGKATSGGGFLTKKAAEAYVRNLERKAALAREASEGGPPAQIHPA